jgi:signal transduction histidine kinase/ActR/RegA family two-component response regulator
MEQSILPLRKFYFGPLLFLFTIVEVCGFLGQLHNIYIICVGVAMITLALWSYLPLGLIDFQKSYIFAVCVLFMMSISPSKSIWIGLVAVSYSSVFGCFYLTRDERIHIWYLNIFNTIVGTYIQYIRFPLQDTWICFFVLTTTTVANICIYVLYSDAIEELKRVNEAKGEFLSLMSHEIRTPITTILATSDLMVMEPDNVKENIQILQNAGGLLLRLLNNILDYSKYTFQHIALNNQSFNLEHIIVNLIAILRTMGAKKQLVINLEYAVEPADQIFYGDYSKIEQIILNVVGNAIKFTEKGSVTLFVKTLGPSTQEHEELVGIELKVVDTGVGMTPSEVEKVFLPFVQGDTGDYLQSQQFCGSGLGMSIVKKIVESMNGVISVTSKKNEGTKVSIVLPLKKSVPVPKSTQEEILDCTDEIVLCEDNPVNGLVLKRLLNKIGFVVETCADGTDLVKHFMSSRWKLVITDYQMPKMNGIQAAKIIKAFQPETRVILLTADISPPVSSDVDIVLSKPVTFESLKGAIYACQKKDLKKNTLSATPAAK